MTTTLSAEAVVGRRIEFAYYSNLHGGAETVWHPGIITATEPGYTTMLACIRLDGERRSGLRIPVDYEGLRYLDEVVDVPELPMGRFHPTAADMSGEYGGVLVCEFEEGDIAFLTADPDTARAALTAYGTAMDMYLGGSELDHLEARWVVFEWEPEDAECPWFMRFADEGDDMAVHVHYLPA